MCASIYVLHKWFGKTLLWYRIYVRSKGDNFVGIINLPLYNILLICDLSPDIILVLSY